VLIKTAPAGPLFHFTIFIKEDLASSTSSPAKPMLILRAGRLLNLSEWFAAFQLLACWS